MTDSYPANAVSLRRIADGNFVVIDITNGQKKIIAEVDYAGAAMTIYEGAIYQIQAKPWQVETLDWEGRKAFVRETRADYYTEAIDYTRLKVLETFDSESHEESLCGHGEVHVIRRVAGYKKIRFYTHENIGYGDVELPDHEMHTTSVWWRLSPGVLEQYFTSMSDALDGFQGAAYALHHSAALATMTETADIGRAVGSGDGSWVGDQSRSQTVRAAARSLEEFEPVIFLYDSFPGEMGIAEPLYQLRSELLERALTLIGRCECTAGCPSCVGPQLRAADSAATTPKQFAVTVLELLSRHQRNAGAESDKPAPTLQ